MKRGGAGLDGFLLANYVDSGRNLGLNYGAEIFDPRISASLAFDPSAAHPGFEFSIVGFRAIHPTLDPATGFWVRAGAGSAKDVIAGEDSIYWTRLQITSVPEPNSAFLLASAGAIILFRVSRRRPLDRTDR